MNRQAKQFSKIAITLAGAAVGLTAGHASAGMSPGSSFLMPADGDVSISFLSQNAGAKGSLYFLGYEAGGSLTYATSSDSNNLGGFLFNTLSSSPGSSENLGAYAAGTRLHFAYIITNGVSVAPTGQVNRSDIGSDLLYFGFDNHGFADNAYSYTLGVEDVKSSSSDFDYNDAMFTIAVTPSSVPGPGAIAITCCAAGFVALRRRGRARN